MFTAAAAPTLSVIREVSPTLAALGARGTPIVRRLPPLTSQVSTFANSLQPVTNTLDKGIADVLGLMEGWSRATQGRDAASHVFRFGLTVSPATFSSLAPLFATKAKASHPSAAQKVVTSALAAGSTPAAAPVAAPSTPISSLLGSLAPTLSTTVKKVTSTLSKVTSTVTSTVVKTVTQTLQKLGLGSPPPSSSSSSSPPPNSLQQLLDYLLR